MLLCHILKIKQSDFPGFVLFLLHSVTHNYMTIITDLYPLVKLDNLQNLYCNCQLIETELYLEQSPSKFMDEEPGGPKRAEEPNS